MCKFPQSGVLLDYFSIFNLPEKVIEFILHLRTCQKKVQPQTKHSTIVDPFYPYIYLS